jgi:uncharacterized protein (TIRG00374 family)
MMAGEPVHLVVLVVATVALTAARVLALAWCVTAFGGSADLSVLLWLYLVVVLVGQLAPTPNGVGAVEVALVLGLYFTGMHPAVAVGAVLTYRVLTLWLPLLPGWRASRSLHRAGAL